MPTVSWLLTHRESSKPISCPPTATVLDAATLMNEHHIGSIAVVNGKELVGIFTERDILRRVVAEGRDPAATNLQDVMSTPVTVASPATPLTAIATLMRDSHIRHVPIVDDGGLVSMISIGDVNKARADEQADTIHWLENFITVW